MVSQSQVGHVDHIATLARTEQEVFWFDVAVVVVSCGANTQSVSKADPTTLKSFSHRKLTVTVPEKVFQVRSE